MPKNYTEISQAIVNAVGGPGNIDAVTHCMTRLRFVVKDKALIDPPRSKRSMACWAWCTAASSAR
ncbi:PTS system N-acetylmuramic acid-specific EIIBC component [Serratia plymuthica]|nr:PTS system N-acetylmuramic acid-specific EIIBC component [Serratia plymuthica]